MRSAGVSAFADECIYCQYVGTCAVNVLYHEHWDDSCIATLGDVLDHAKRIFRKCNNGLLHPSGRCEGQVPFTVPNCPADVQITFGLPVEGRHDIN